MWYCDILLRWKNSKPLFLMFHPFKDSKSYLHHDLLYAVISPASKIKSLVFVMCGGPVVTQRRWPWRLLATPFLVITVIGYKRSRIKAKFVVLHGLFPYSQIQLCPVWWRSIPSLIRRQLWALHRQRIHRLLRLQRWALNYHGLLHRQHLRCLFTILLLPFFAFQIPLLVC